MKMRVVCLLQKGHVGPHPTPESQKFLTLMGSDRHHSLVPPLHHWCLSPEVICNYIFLCPNCLHCCLGLSRPPLRPIWAPCFCYCPIYSLSLSTQTSARVHQSSSSPGEPLLLSYAPRSAAWPHCSPQLTTSLQNCFCSPTSFKSLLNVLSSKGPPLTMCPDALWFPLDSCPELLSLLREHQLPAGRAWISI
jgi:hypothetical protein